MAVGRRLAVKLRHDQVLAARKLWQSALNYDALVLLFWGIEFEFCSTPPPFVPMKNTRGLSFRRHSGSVPAARANGSGCSVRNHEFGRTARRESDAPMSARVWVDADERPISLWYQW